MSNTAINNKQQELQQALAGARSSQATSNKGNSSDSSLSLTSASAMHLGSALNGATSSISPTTLSMLSKQTKDLDTEQQRLTQIIQTLSSQVESLSKGAPNGAGDPNTLASLLSQRYLGESEQTQGFTEAYSAQLGPHTDPSLFSMLAQESKKLDPTEDEEDGKTTENTVGGAEEEASSAKDPNSAQGRDAIFAAAGKMQTLVKDSENNMIQSLERQIQMLEAQLKSMEEMLKFMEQEGQYLTKYLDDPSYKNLESLISFLKQHFTGDSSVENMLDTLSNLGKVLKDIFGSDFEKAVWSAIDNTKLSCLGNKSINQYLTDLMGQVSGNSGLFTEFMRYGQKDFEQIVARLITNLAEVVMLYDVLTGKGSGAIFDMESILMNLEQVAINNNAKQSDQRKEMADAVQKGLDNTMNKLIKAQQKIAKAEHESHHHGIFGAIFDFFKSIFDKIADILKGVADLVTGNVSGFEDNMKKGFDGFAKFFKGIFKACEQILDGLEHGNFNEILKGFTTLAADAVMVAVLGPVGAMMLTGTSFSKDIKNLTKIVVDAVGALGQVIVAGFEKLAYAMGDKSADALANSNLENCKKLGEDIITNPQFQTFMDIVAIVMIVASVVSQQYWLAGIMVVMLVANDFGGTQWVTSKLAEGLEDLLHACGVKDTSKLKEWCQVAADLIVIVAVMLTGSFSGAFEAGAEEAGEAGAEFAAEDGIEMTDFAAQDATSATTEATQTTSEAAEESESAAKKVVNKAIETAKAALRNNGTALMTLGASLGSTSIGIDLAKAAGGKDDEKLQEILMILQMCISLAFSLAGGVGMGLSEDVNAFTQKINGAVRKISSTLADYMENNLSSLTRLNTFVQGGGMIMQGGADAGKGAMQLLAADLMKQIATYQTDMTLFEATNKDNNAGIQQNNQQLKAIIQEFEQIVKNFDAPSKAGEGVEAAMLQNS